MTVSPLRRRKARATLSGVEPMEMNKRGPIRDQCGGGLADGALADQVGAGPLIEWRVQKFFAKLDATMYTMQHVAFAKRIDIAPDRLHGHIKPFSKRPNGHGTLLQYQEPRSLRVVFASLMTSHPHGLEPSATLVGEKQQNNILFSLFWPLFPNL